MSAAPAPGEPSGPPPPVIPYATQWIEDDDIAAVEAVLRSDLLTQGPVLARFETALAAATGARHAIAVSSGTAALHLTALALGVDASQTGVTSPITFAATANAFLYCGAAVTFSDVDPRTGLLDPAALDATLTRLTARGVPPGLVIAVSLAGRVADLPALQAVTDRHRWQLVEDAAHSLGATYRAGGREYSSASCAHTRAAVLSFHPVKHVCAGEGGAILVNDDALAARLRRLRTHGIEKPTTPPPGEGSWYYEQLELGYHYRLTEIQAALGESQLRKLPSFLARRRALAARYSEALARDPFTRLLTTPVPDPGHAWHLYVIHLRTPALRRALYDHLAAAGIRSQVHYIPVYRHPHHRARFTDTPLPGAEAWYGACLSLPLYPKMSDADHDRVLAALATFARAHA